MKKLFVVLAVAIALVSAGAALAAITGSKHDLTANSNTYYTTATTEICVFCHTPHNAVTGANVTAPLWNKTYTSNVTFTAYGNTMRGSTTAASMTNATRTCLSCHDGTQAMNSLNNGPGSGNTAIANTGLGPISGVTVIDGDFRNDHPIGVTYVTGNDLATPSGVSPTSGIVKIGGVNNVLATSGTDTVECSSCHSVHNDSGIALFLPVANTSSQLCLTCHLK
jgi:hypothetical protein